ncbi:hypothetical protein ACFFHT_00480 [Gallibacterium melopsittaci]|uniref:Uncharacterized protein n=1 Tax=Gallibacterium melopsittaci TaxID=516063 RepID=A0ABV6HT54_9PAST
MADVLHLSHHCIVAMCLLESSQGGYFYLNGAERKSINYPITFKLKPLYTGGFAPISGDRSVIENVQFNNTYFSCSKYTAGETTYMYLATGI